jgi:glycerophosphoryl diester phosphodiesterase
MRWVGLAATLALAACGADLQVTQPGTRSHTLAPTNLPSFFDCLRRSGGAVISAHRGGPEPGFAENTVDAFANTLSTAPAFIEVDVRATRDGALFLMHDETVDRTTSGRGRLNELTRAEVRALRVEDGAGTPLNLAPTELSLALAWARGNTVLELDIKPEVRFEDVIEEVRAASAMGRVVFITYSVDGASRLARLAPEAMISTTITSVRDLDTLERRGVDLSHIVAWLGDEELDEGVVSALAERGVEARFGVFGRDDRFAEMAEAGVQSLAVDDVGAAYRAADAADGEEGYAALQCAAAQ